MLYVLLCYITYMSVISHPWCSITYPNSYITGLHSMLYKIICNMCLSNFNHPMISTVISSWHACLQAQLHSCSCQQSSIFCLFLMPLLSICHSDMQWLPPHIQPHPEVELVLPTSVALPSAGISNSSFVVAKSMGQGGCAVSSHNALHHWHMNQHILSLAQIKARQCCCPLVRANNVVAVLIA
jgi:hypothetical protein